MPVRVPGLPVPPGLLNVPGVLGEYIKGAARKS